MFCTYQKLQRPAWIYVKMRSKFLNKQQTLDGFGLHQIKQNNHGTGQQKETLCSQFGYNAIPNKLLVKTHHLLTPSTPSTR